MASENTHASDEADTGVPEGLARLITGAAERGDRFAFTVAAGRLGSVEEAQALVRSKGIVRMVDRVAVRTAAPALLPHGELRDASSEGDGTTMFGHFAVFDEWTEIDSWFEGNFLERIAPGAFKKTFRENRAEMKSLFQHGMDPQIGDKPLGPIADLREDDTGGYYEVELLDAPYVRDDILPGLRADLYGASFRFQMIREEFDQKPDPSETNPNGLPERTLKELRLFEFGPVTFPAYPSATAGVRSQDLEAAEAKATPPAEGAETKHHPDKNLVGAGAVSHPDPVRRGLSTYSLNRKEEPSWRL
ncbi:MAG: HK97 family phage prohead protease [Gemmatimonadaceae bacterium]|nr:HK97 family phage prohead protease [Gemmatimonadaceae bacterium]